MQDAHVIETNSHMKNRRRRETLVWTRLSCPTLRSRNPCEIESQANRNHLDNRHGDS